jgi:hypothetical protein
MTWRVASFILRAIGDIDRDGKVANMRLRIDGSNEVALR